MLKHFAKHVLLVVALSGTGAAFAAADPTLHEVYAAAESGHLDQAQQMISQVLRDHPDSAKAHYVAAELYAKAGKAVLARDELSSAERLQPGLPFAQPQAVQALKAELGAAAQRAPASVPVVAGGSGFPWGIALAVFAGLAVFWLLRRRSANVVYPQAVGPAGSMNGMPGGYGAPGGGMGSGIVGGLASGLAVGAGVVAGEELARHFLDGDRHSGSGALPLDNNVIEPSGNSDMGGSDFGVSDPGSWDDGGGSGMDDSDWS